MKTQIATILNDVQISHADDYELDERARALLSQCSCAHCEEGDGICPASVAMLVKEQVEDALVTVGVKAEEAANEALEILRREHRNPPPLMNPAAQAGWSIAMTWVHEWVRTGVDNNTPETAGPFVRNANG